MRLSVEGIGPQPTASMLRPMGGAGCIRMVRMEEPWGGIGEAEDSMAPRHTLLHDQHRPPRRLRERCTRGFGADNHVPSQSFAMWKRSGEMKGNDHRMGHMLSRREAVALLGATGAAWLLGEHRAPPPALAGLASPACIVRPEQTEGPYFLDEKLNRSDIRSDPSTKHVKAGTPLMLTFQIMRIGAESCLPLSGALVDIWHCDAMGVYSDVRDPWFDTIGQQFLRGYQVTDTQGEARFVTVYPGWYPGRTVHIHFKIRTGSADQRRFDFTSQLYFSDELTDRIHSQQPYISRGSRMTRNRHDGIFRHGGDRLIPIMTSTTDGYAATFPIGLQLP